MPTKAPDNVAAGRPAVTLDRSDSQWRKTPLYLRDSPFAKPCIDQNRPAKRIHDLWERNRRDRNNPTLQCKTQLADLIDTLRSHRVQQTFALKKSIHERHAAPHGNRSTLVMECHCMACAKKNNRDR